MNQHQIEFASPRSHCLLVSRVCLIKGSPLQVRATHTLGAPVNGSHCFWLVCMAEQPDRGAELKLPAVGIGKLAESPVFFFLAFDVWSLKLALQAEQSTFDVFVESASPQNK